MRILLLNTSESPCPGTHYAACTEFMNGFTEYGYTPDVVTDSLNDISGAEYILLSNHKVNIEYLKILNRISPDSIYILWFYFDYVDKIPFNKYILTGERWHRPPLLPSHLKYYNMIPSLSNYVPLHLLANESPEKIGTYTRNETINGCFMGTPYKYQWTIGLENVLYHNINKSGLLSYDIRRKVYLSSKIAFGFHHDNNILNSHVTQRVFEALCYGCVVLSDNSAATDITDGIVVYVKDKRDFIEKYIYYLSNPEECEKKRIAGYEWAKKFGTNRYAAKLFLDVKIKTSTT